GRSRSTPPTSWASPSCASWSPSPRWSPPPRACGYRPPTGRARRRASVIPRDNASTGSARTGRPRAQGGGRRAREAAARVLRGDSLRSLVLDLNTRGVRTVRGSQWSESPLRHLLCRPSLAGLRSYHGEVVAKGSWPAILDEV